MLDEPQQSVPTYQDYTSYAADPVQTEYEWTEEETAAYNAYYYGSAYTEQSAEFQVADHAQTVESDPSTELNLSDAPVVVEAHEVIAEEALIYEEPMQPVAATSWSCRQCTFLNPLSESFCEMCMDHISLSMPSEAMEQPIESFDSADASNEELACDVTVEEQLAVHNAVMVSIIPSPQYAPSAPDFDQEQDDNAATASFKELQVSAGDKDQPPAPPLSSADFLSLAFRSKSPVNAIKPQETRPAAGATTIEYV